MNPRVSVVVPVHNTAPYLERCFGSVLSQSLGQDHWEVVAVDDGSTDGSAAWLDDFARERANVTVVHQEASGGAGKPRNVGIEHARGEFLFFLDSDDHLGPQALERLLAMADEHGSDVVYGRIVGGGGRPAPVDLRRSNPDVSLFDSPVYWTLAAYKLWRRTLIDGHRLRFVENRLRGEDVPFSVKGLLNARRISVVADHDCYVLEGREDNSNASEQDIDWVDHLRHGESILHLVGEHVPAGADRDKLVERHFHGEILSVFGSHFAALDEEERAMVAKTARPVVQEWLTDRIFQALPPRLRLRAHCLREGLLEELTHIVRADAGGEVGPAVVRDGRAWAPYPYFRDGTRALPDACYDLTSRVVLRQSAHAWTWEDGVLAVTGNAALTLLPAAGQQAALVLRNGAAEHRVPAVRTENGDYRAEVDPARAAGAGPLSDGNWTVRLEVGAPAEDGGEPLTKIAWLSAPEPAPLPVARLTGGGDAPLVAAAVYASEPHRHTNLDIGAQRHRLGPDACAAVARRPLGAPRVTAAVTLPDCPEDAELELVLALGEQRVVLETEVTRLSGSRFTLRGTLAHASEGRWEIRIRVRGRGFSRDVPVADAGDRTAGAVLDVPAHWKWTRRLTL
ncbi:glycosyltransferase family 2 protein [Streptomyces sp. CA-294286]|uniref:glycosyltransferase family 2 protein n=1 Tax=Streptomyces sp. CA-294286 TaxID=3240070 RepID=UPI003D94D7D4